MEIDVAVSEWGAADGVTADAHGRNGRDLAEWKDLARSEGELGKLKI